MVFDDFEFNKFLNVKSFVEFIRTGSGKVSVTNIELSKTGTTFCSPSEKLFAFAIVFTKIGFVKLCGISICQTQF